MMRLRFRFLRSKNLYINGFLVCLSTLFIFVIIDLLAFYAVGIKYPDYGMERFFQFSPFLGHFHTPNEKGLWYTYRDGTRHFVSTNSFGFPDIQRSVDKTKPRIALIGDSVTQFWEMEEEERGHVLIEKALGGRYETLNFGVRGYGTDRTFLVFQRVGVCFSPDIVIYNFCINDIYDNSYRFLKPYYVLDDGAEMGLHLENRPLEIPPGDHSNSLPYSVRFGRFLNKYSFSYRMFYGKLKSKVIDRMSRKLVGTKETPAISLDDHWELRPYKKEYNQEDEERWEITKRIVLKLNRFVRERGVKLLVVECLDKPSLDGYLQYKTKKMYGDVFDFGKVSALLSDCCRESGIAFLSLYDVAKERELNVREFFHPSDNIHFNNKGAKFYSDCVVDTLLKLEWVESKKASRDTAGPFNDPSSNVSP